VDGENHFCIKPVPGGTLNFAAGEYKSIYGNVKSGWERIDRGYRFSVTIPPNTDAEIILPNGETHIVNSGTYSYTIDEKLEENNYV
jgi:alpha-L-rhamnosidase